MQQEIKAEQTLRELYGLQKAAESQNRMCSQGQAKMQERE